MTTPRLRIVRAFNCGVLLVATRSTHDLRRKPPASPDITRATRAAGALGVLHTQDSEFATKAAAVTVFVGVDTSVDFTTDINIASGVLDVGNAERSERLISQQANGGWP